MELKGYKLWKKVIQRAEKKPCDIVTIIVVNHVAYLLEIQVCIRRYRTLSGKFIIGTIIRRNYRQ